MNKENSNATNSSFSNQYCDMASGLKLSKAIMDNEAQNTTRANTVPHTVTASKEAAQTGNDLFVPGNASAFADYKCSHDSDHSSLARSSIGIALMDFRGSYELNGRQQLMI